MAKDGNTYAKRQRETLKRQKQEEKRHKRQKRKDEPAALDAPSNDPTGLLDVDDPLVSEI